LWNFTKSVLKSGELRAGRIKKKETNSGINMRSQEVGIEEKD